MPQSHTFYPKVLRTAFQVEIRILKFLLDKKTLLKNQLVKKFPILKLLLMQLDKWHQI